ncbi:Hypothetical protein D9617_5g069900 [Elsinoe fawcettii]|nr:Hypothetical protein D9617_5g069900 [Elsinoe fawcettii]
MATRFWLFVVLNMLLAHAQGVRTVTKNRTVTVARRTIAKTTITRTVARRTITETSTTTTTVRLPRTVKDVSTVTVTQGGLASTATVMASGGLQNFPVTVTQPAFCNTTSTLASQSSLVTTAPTLPTSSSSLTTRSSGFSISPSASPARDAGCPSGIKNGNYSYSGRDYIVQCGTTVDTEAPV